MQIIMATMNICCRISTKIIMLMKLMITFVQLATTSASEEFPIAKHGCKDKCGNVTIPYPFGMTEECHHSDEFFIFCNDTYDPPKPFLGTGNINFADIYLDGKLCILQDVATDCYNASGFTHGSTVMLNMTRFTVSETDNVFVAIGCDTSASLNGNQSGNGYVVGCISKCNNISYVPNDTCSGIGCCQTSLARGVTDLSLDVDSFNKHEGILDFNPCSFAFVIDKEQFKFSRALLKDFEFQDSVPTIVEWSIGEDDCETVRKSEMYNACQGNSTCYDPGNRPGYRCKCLDGYRGNPYLPFGCQDIDECKNTTLNDCERICVNAPGSYKCLCPKGYRGDGRKNGQGCIAVPHRSLVIPLTLSFCIGLGMPLLVATTWLSYKIVKRSNEKKQREEFFKRNGGLLLEQQVSSGDGVEMPIKLLRSKELERATDSYNENRILGHGGQGTVYKGMLEDGRIVAIKKSKKIDECQLGPFINEVVVLQQINHRNIVKLLGCCLETEVPMLVYEFIPNGMLSHYLHCQNEEFPMTWDMRLRIAVEVADALSYLHSAASNPIYHCDIKSANILLDEKYRAKIADFGIARPIDLDQTHLTTPNVQGTFGYLDPEYFRTSQFTDKSDAYSFGVVLAELLTGQKPISSTRSENERSLASYFLVAMEEDRLFEIVDNRVVKEGPEEAIVAMAKVAQRCLNMTGRNRPAMREVVTELQSIRRSQDVSTKHDDEEVEVEHYNDITVSQEATSRSTRSYLDSGTQSSYTDIEPLLVSIETE